MRKVFVAIIGTASAFAYAESDDVIRTTKSPEINVASFNMAFCRNTSDLRVWEARRDQIPALIRFHNFDICGSQEPYAFQIKWLAEQMPEYGFVEDLMGDETPEKFSERTSTFMAKNLILPNMNNAIWYKKAKFELLKSGKFWFSKTPETRSGGFDEDRFDSERHCTWALFKDSAYGEEFYFFNVHMVCRRKNPDTEQVKGMELLIAKIKEIAGDKTFFVTGDFNANNKCDSIKLALSSNYLFDTRQKSITPPYGPEYTFSGFHGEMKNASIIDFIFASKDVNVLKFGVITDHIGNVYPSDHLPIVSRVALKSEK